MYKLNFHGFRELKTGNRKLVVLSSKCYLKITYFHGIRNGIYGILAFAKIFWRHMTIEYSAKFVESCRYSWFHIAEVLYIFRFSYFNENITRRSYNRYLFICTYKRVWYFIVSCTTRCEIQFKYQVL